jgi:glycosyltransferase involved in cell wall biosynthesis
MRVLIVNYRYFESGGPERYMFGVTDLLEKAGHEVIPFSVRYARNRETPWSKHFVEPIAGEDEVYYNDHSWSIGTVRRGLQRAFYAPDVYASVSELVAASKPDVALVLHYLRKLSPSVLVALKRSGIPTVVRLSDFAMICPQAHLLRQGQICRSCLTHGLMSSVWYRCVQGSLGASAVTCASMWYAKWRGYFDLIDHFISPSETLRQQMIDGGYDGSRIQVLPTFVDSDRFGPVGEVRKRRIVYVGRLTPEKGASVLVDAYERLIRREGLADVELVVTGRCEDPYATELRSRATRVSSLVTFVGQVDADAIRELLSSSVVSVVPSVWYENVPNSMLESFAAGTPVVASDLGAMSEMLRSTEAGVLFRAGDPADLAAALELVLTQPDRWTRMSEAATALALNRYSPQAHLAGLLEILDSVRASAAPASD